VLLLLQAIQKCKTTEAEHWNDWLLTVYENREPMKMKEPQENGFIYFILVHLHLFSLPQELETNNHQT
jgi:hypothetical protein